MPLIESTAPIQRWRHAFGRTPRVRREFALTRSQVGLSRRCSTRSARGVSTVGDVMTFTTRCSIGLGLLALLAVACSSRDSDVEAKIQRLLAAAHGAKRPAPR